MKRKCLILLLLAASVLPSWSQTPIALLKYGGGGDWYANPTSLTNLIAFCNADAKMNLAKDYAVVDVGSAELFNYPFVHMTGHGNVVFSSQEAQNLRNYLLAGGFLHIDDNYGLKDFIIPAMKKVFPELDFVELPFSHPIYHQKYQFPNGLPKIHEHDNLPPGATASFGKGGWCASSAGSATLATAGKTPTCTTTAKPSAPKPSRWAKTSCSTPSPSRWTHFGPPKPPPPRPSGTSAISKTYQGLYQVVGTTT